MKDGILVLEQFLLDNNIDTEYFRNLNKNSESYLTITNKLVLGKFLIAYCKSDFQHFQLDGYRRRSRILG